MHRPTLMGIIALVLITMITPIQAQDQPSTNPQILSISTSPRLDPAPTLQDYLDAFQLVHHAGVDGDLFTAKWSELEPSSGNYVIKDYLDGMASYESLYPDTLLLGIQVLNTTAKETPPDLLDVPFDDPRMLQRFETLFDAMLPQLSHVRYLSIGNEVDVYLANHQEWAAYKTFYDGALAYVHQVAPGMQVGVTTTFSGTRAHKAEVMRLNQHSDVLMLTYYPLSSRFTADNPDAPLQDFPMMIDWAAGLPVILQEVGYPSAALLNSSEAEQAQFVRSVFAAWKSAGSAIPFLNYFLLHDLTEDICGTLEGYYGVKNANFHAYLCSIGLRQADGTPKQAWQTFVDQAATWKAGMG